MNDIIGSLDKIVVEYVGVNMDLQIPLLTIGYGHSHVHIIINP
jgi:hypothetical protein